MTPIRALALAAALLPAFAAAQTPATQTFPPPLSQPTPAAHPFHILALFSTNVEGDHVDFARQAIAYLSAAGPRDHFTFESSTDWDRILTVTPSPDTVLLWLDDQPHTPAQRAAFEAYMEHGGAWLGFHIAAFNTPPSHHGQSSDPEAWTWFNHFLGGGYFFTNSWPPLPATLTVDAPSHPVTRGLPATFTAPANEWYIWQPSPRSNPDVTVLLTLSPSNFPLGFKDILTAGDLPVVWTNRRFRMLTMNMGHGDRIFSTPTQNLLIENSILWLASLPAPTSH